LKQLNTPSKSNLVFNPGVVSTRRAFGVIYRLFGYNRVCERVGWSPTMSTSCSEVSVIPAFQSEFLQRPLCMAKSRDLNCRFSSNNVSTTSSEAFSYPLSARMAFVAQDNYAPIARPQEPSLRYEIINGASKAHQISNQDQLFAGYFDSRRPIHYRVSDVWSTQAGDWTEYYNVWTN